MLFRICKLTQFIRVVNFFIRFQTVLCDILISILVWRTKSRRAHARGRALQADAATTLTRSIVGPTHRGEIFSRMTIVTTGDESTLEQIVKQLNKLPNVIKVQNFSEGEYVDRELLLVKVGVDSKSRAEVMQITDIFRAGRSWTCSPSR